jgi:hypothetical protein
VVPSWNEGVAKTGSRAVSFAVAAATVFRTNEKQVWVLSQHLADMALIHRDTRRLTSSYKRPDLVQLCTDPVPTCV